MARGPRPWRRARTLREYDFTVLRVREDLFIDPRDGSEHPRAIIAAPEWAHVVAHTPAGQVILVRQFRFGSGEEGLELPGGVVDPGETPAQAIARELEEETGHRATTIESLGWLWPNPAHFTNRVHTFIARDCQRIRDGTPERSEDLVVELVDAEAIPALIRSGAIRHALHVAALHLALHGESAE